MAERTDLELSANRMDLVTRWADDLAHEIKNPLHAMVINLELVKRRAAGGEPEPIIQRAEVVESELHRVHALVDSLLRLIRPWPDQTMADGDRILELLLPVVRARARIRKIDYEHATGSLPVPMPPGDMALVLLNLLDNALDATPEGGRVSTRFEADGGRVRLTVADTGAGVPGPILDRVLQPGVSGRDGRAGLGLAVSDRLIRYAGGELRLEPVAGGTGTVVTVDLPRSGSA